MLLSTGRVAVARIARLRRTGLLPQASPFNAVAAHFPQGVSAQAIAGGMSTEAAAGSQELQAVRAAKTAARKHVKGLLKQLSLEAMDSESEDMHLACCTCRKKCT